MRLGLAGFVSAADNWFVSPALPAITHGLGVPAMMGAYLLAAYLLPYGLLQPVYGFLSDRSSKVKWIRFLTAGLTVGTLGCAMSVTFSFLLFFRLLTGCFAAGIIAVSLGIIGDRESSANQQLGVGTFMGIVFLGQGLSAGLGGILVSYLRWEGAFLTFGILSVLAFLACVTMDGEEKKKEKEPFVYGAVIKEIVLSPLGRWIFPLALYTGFCLVGTYSFLGNYLHDRMGLSYISCGLVITCYGLACLFGGRNSGKIQRYLGSWGVLKSGAVLGLGALLFLTIAPSWELVLVAIIFLGFSYIFIQSTLASLVFRISSTYRGFASGLVGTGLFCGGGLGSLVGAGVVTLGGYDLLWKVFLVALIGLYGFIRYKGKKEEQPN